MDIRNETEVSAEESSSKAAAKESAPEAGTNSSVKNEATQVMPAGLTDELATDLVQLFKLLSDETRLRIVFHLLEQKELHVRALCELLKQSQPAVSHHLALLRVAGLIECRRDGKHNYYYLLPERVEMLTRKMLDAAPGEDGELRFKTLALRCVPIN